MSHPERPVNSWPTSPKAPYVIQYSRADLVRLEPFAAFPFAAYLLPPAIYAPDWRSKPAPPSADDVAKPSAPSSPTSDRAVDSRATPAEVPHPSGWPATSVGPRRVPGKPATETSSVAAIEIQVGIDVKRRVSRHEATVSATSGAVVAAHGPTVTPVAVGLATMAGVDASPSASVKPHNNKAEDELVRAAERLTLAKTAIADEPTPPAPAGKGGLSPTRRLIHGALGLPRSRKETALDPEVAPPSPSTPAGKPRSAPVPVPPLTPDESPESGHRRSSAGRIGSRRSDPRAASFVRDVPKIERHLTEEDLDAKILRIRDENRKLEEQQSKVDRDVLDHSPTKPGFVPDTETTLEHERERNRQRKLQSTGEREWNQDRGLPPSATRPSAGRRRASAPFLQRAEPAPPTPETVTSVDASNADAVNPQPSKSQKPTLKSRAASARAAAPVAPDVARRSASQKDSELNPKADGQR